VQYLVVNGAEEQEKGRGPRRALICINVLLIIRVELLTTFVRSPCGGDNGYGTLQGKVQDALRGQLDLLPVSCRLHPTAKSAAGSRADTSALTAAGDAADDRANCRARTDFLSRVLSARGALTAILIGLNVVVLASH